MQLLATYLSFVVTLVWYVTFQGHVLSRESLLHIFFFETPDWLGVMPAIRCYVTANLRE